MDIDVLACSSVDERAYRWMYSVDGPSMVRMPSMDELLLLSKTAWKIFSTNEGFPSMNLHEKCSDFSIIR